ncbi:MAG: SWIM zinc finger family protein [Woeseiaceae bacterium]|nr:SWIM zinc finger family protein [Woeseiaceae bacterium]
MSELRFLVQGSSTVPYEVTFIKDGDSLTALCTCPAGQHGNFCKHRIAILDGDAAAISSDNAGEAAVIVDWLRGTDVEAALGEMRRLEASTEVSKSALNAARRKLVRAMHS